MYKREPASQFILDVKIILQANARSNAVVRAVPNSYVRRKWNADLDGILTKASFTITRANGVVSEVLVKRIECGGKIRFYARENGAMMGMANCPADCKSSIEYYDALDAAVHWC